MKKELCDELLMERLVRGDKKVAGILYDRYFKKIYGYFVRMTNEKETSRDLTQNVFLKILKYSHSWKSDKVFAYWIFRIARNTMIDHYNESQKFWRDNDDQKIHNEIGIDPEQEMEMKESCSLLLQAMKRLSHPERELIELSRFQGLSYKEIAQMVMSTEGAVRVKTFRAILKLKEIYTKIMVA